MNTLESILNPPHDCTIVSWRNFHGTREQLFKAWTDPERLKLWWGPKGFTNTFYEFDPKPGGKWRFTMHGPDGGNYENESVFLRVQEPDLIVLHHISEPRFHVVATFEAHGEETRLVFTMVFETPEKRKKIEKIAVEGNEQNFDRLEAVLIQMHQDAQKL